MNVCKARPLMQSVPIIDFDHVLRSVTRLEAAVYADPKEKLVGSRPPHKLNIYCGYHTKGYR